MKNPTILKDEIRVLSADRSAVLMELRSSSDKLKETQKQIQAAEKELVDIKTETEETRARLNDMVSRAFVVNDSIADSKKELESLRKKAESSDAENSNKSKLHLGRIKELTTTEKSLSQKIDTLESTLGSKIKNYQDNLTELEKKIVEKNRELDSLSASVSELESKADMIREEEKKITKDRLKREDKVRAREKALDLKEIGLNRKEESLSITSTDLMVVYSRLKEAYAKHDPKMDIDKLIKLP